MAELCGVVSLILLTFMSFANCCIALLKPLLVLGLLSSCRSERVAFQLPSPTPITNSKSLLISAVEPRYQFKDAVIAASSLNTSATTRKSTLVVTANSTRIKRHKMALESKQLSHISFIDKPFRHKKVIANQADDASNGWKGFGEFMLLASLPLALFGALAGAVFNVSFLTGLAYVMLGFAAFFVLVLLAVAAYQAYNKSLALRSKKA